MDDDTRQKILDLYKKGNSIQEVADKVDYHKSTVYRKIDEAGITRSMSEASPNVLSEKHKENIRKGMAESDKKIGSKSLELKENYNEATEELGYFFGVMAGDGYIVSQGGIGLENKDKEVVDAFASAIESQFGLEPQIYKREAEEMKDWRTGKTHERSERWILRKKSVNLQNFCQNTPEDWILGQEENVRKAWIRGLWDSDGCINHHSQQVYLYNKDTDLIERYEQTLKELFGIEASHYIRQGEVYLSYFGQKKQIETFYKEIKPTIKRKRAKFEKVLG